MKIDKLKSTLKSLLKTAENNYVLDQEISKNVASHTKRYIEYQLVEMLLIIITACAQTFLIKRLITPCIVV